MVEAEPIVPDFECAVAQRSVDVDPPSGCVTFQAAPTSNHVPVGVVVNLTETVEPNSVDWKLGAAGVPSPCRRASVGFDGRIRTRLLWRTLCRIGAGLSPNVPLSLNQSGDLDCLFKRRRKEGRGFPN
jgi:hypothetical protein